MKHKKSKGTFQTLFVYYIKLVLKPVAFNLFVLLYLVAAYYKNYSLQVAAMLVASVFVLPLIPLTSTIMIGLAHKKGREHGGDGHYNNPYKEGSKRFDAYNTSFEERLNK